MKKLILVLLFILSIISITGVKGSTLESPFDDYYTYTPRFSYFLDTLDRPQYFAMTFEQNDDTDDTLYKIDIEQMDNNGNVINLLNTFYIDPEDPLSTGVYSDYIAYDWSDSTVVDTLEDNDIVFYRVMYNNSIVLYTGGIMLKPEFTEYESSRVEFGDYVYNDSGLVDLGDQTQFTYNLSNDNIIILHYRFNTDVIAQGVNNYIMVRDLNTMTTEFALDSENILSIQGGSDVDCRNSFIPVFISDSFPTFLETDIEIFNTWNDELFYDIELGTYLVYLEGDTFSYISGSEATALLNVSNLDKPFNVIVNYNSIDISKKQKITFLKDNEYTNSVYETTFARDQSLLSDWSEDVDLNNPFSIGYSILDTLEAGDNVEVVWYLEPITLPFSIDTSDYIINDIGSYEVAGESNLGDSITTTIDWFGWNNTIGLLFVSVAIIILINIIMIAQNLLIMPLLIINGTVLGLLSFMGFLPIWLIIGEFLILILGFGIKALKGGN